MKIFGNDGFRSEFGQQYMTLEFLTAFCHGLVDYYEKRNLNMPIVVGKDTRSSGLIIENLLLSILNYRGIHTISCGVIPTPGLSNRLKTGTYSMGVMITASHNPFCDNGIKLFAGNGYKIPASEEHLIEEYILKRLNKEYIGFADRLGKQRIIALERSATSVIDEDTNAPTGARSLVPAISYTDIS